jgi:D-aminoacyl-tRNA deacylase
MRLVIQRVREAHVTVENSTVGSIRTGLVALIGISRSDTNADADYLVDKLIGLRVFTDTEGKMNLNVQQAGGALLLISQFTLYGDCHRGRRPSFDQAAPAEQAQKLYNHFVARARRGPVLVETGIFQASMLVHLVNDGPVTILIDSADRNGALSRSIPKATH